MIQGVGFRRLSMLALLTCIALISPSCAGSPDGGGSGENVILADTSFLADIAANVAGDRFVVESLVPVGTDPHSFEPTPRDAQRVEVSRAVIINIRGFIPTLDELVIGAGGAGKELIEAAAGLPGLGDDPHYWLDPIFVIDYTQNIADGLSKLDPLGEQVYRENAEAYAEELRRLDSWIREQVQSIPQERRLLVTNHENLGWFAARYGFEVVGAVFPTTGGEGSPSARQLAELVEDIRATGAPAIFVETGGNAALAVQVGNEAGVRVVTDLYAHSLSEGVSSYVEMMRWNVDKIVEALR